MNKKKALLLAKNTQEAVNIANNTENVKKGTFKINDLKVQIIELPNLLKQKADLNSKNTEILVKMRNSKSSADFFEKHHNCPTCRQDIQSSHKEMFLNEWKISNDADQNVFDWNEKQIKDLDIKINDMQLIQNKIDELNRAIDIWNRDIDTRQRYIKQVEDEVSRLKNNSMVTMSETELNNAEIELKDLKHKKILLTEEQEYHETVAALLKDGGIKAKIVKQFIPIMNKLINEYLTRFGLPIEFVLDEQFNESIKSRYRDTFKYDNFSEGEKQRIDMALLFAWRQIARNKNTTNINLLMFDETFAEKCDSYVIDEIMSILKEMDKNSNIFIISHNNNLIEHADNVLEFEKVGNFSTVK